MSPFSGYFTLLCSLPTLIPQWWHCQVSDLGIRVVGTSEWASLLRGCNICIFPPAKLGMREVGLPCYKGKLTTSKLKLHAFITLPHALESLHEIVDIFR